MKEEHIQKKTLKNLGIILSVLIITSFSLVLLSGFSASWSYNAQSGEIFYFSRDNSMPLWTYKTDYNVLDVHVSENGAYIVMGASDGYVYFFEKTSDMPVWKF